MQKTVHFFNPENDMALASGVATYTPAKGALLMRKAGALLPMWWAAPDDLILTPDGDFIDDAQLLKSRFSLNGTPGIKTTGSSTIDPWGWSRYTCDILARHGAAESAMPSERQIDTLRMLSHRRNGIKVCKLIGVPEHLIPTEAFTPDQAEKAISRFENAVIKLPWSSSGRGILYSGQIPHGTLMQYIKGMINRQGSITIEPQYEKSKDFATLYYAWNGEVEFKGLSAFRSDGRGFYNGNLVMGQHLLEAEIGIDLTDTIEKISRALAEVYATDYSGWIGVDMLSHISHGKICVAPCIEVNLRRTMGVAAMFMAEKLNGEQAFVRLTPDGLELKELKSGFSLI